MDKMTLCLDGLLKKDQDSIISFRRGEITSDELSISSFFISKKFLECIRAYGFPYRNMVTENTYKSAITLALHLQLSDLKYIYDRYINNQPVNKINPEHKAVFIDKIRVISGQTQLYGTQYRVDKNMNVELLPLENDKDINKIREEAGLKPLEDYIESVKRGLIAGA